MELYLKQKKNVMATMQILGDYTIINKLGEGAFGEVLLAEHRFIKKKYAIKLLPEDLSSDSDFIERFEKDVSVLATLDHPSIVKVHNISYAEGRYFLVMDAIVDENNQPQTLTSFLQKQGKILSEMQLETILRQIASALDYAHRTRFEDGYLAHRGLKPSNILIDDSDKNIRVYLSDFSLSNIIGEGKVLLKRYESYLKNLSFDQTTEDNFLHDFLFLAPEQRNLQSLKIDQKADVYAFGVLTYFIIMRKYPEGYFEMPSKVAVEYKLNWDLLIAKCLQQSSIKRPSLLNEAMNSYLSTLTSDASSVDVLSWEEVEKKVENAMQMSFEFTVDDATATQTEQTSTEPMKISEEPSDLKPILKPQELERPTYEPDPGAIFQKELNVSTYQPQKVEVREVEPILTEMMIVPGGSFTRGSNEGARDESPLHRITLSSFAIDIHSVTNEQFVRFLESMGGEKDSNNNDIIRLRDSRIKRTAGKYIIESGYLKHPVVGVTWYGANGYAKWIGKRLPTEAEWEIAAKGAIEEGWFPTGTEIDHTQANFFNSDTTAVMSYPPNGYGLYDVVGNVYEWCEDWYAYNYYDTSLQEPENPSGPRQGVYRVLRGGCWKSLKEDLRCSHRHRNNPGAVNGTYGFRCAADVS